MNVVHICSFRGKREPFPPPTVGRKMRATRTLRCASCQQTIEPFSEMTVVEHWGGDGPCFSLHDACEPTAEMLGPLPLPKPPRCDGAGKNGRGRCTARGTIPVAFAWGGGMYCERCATEECGP